MRIVVAHLLSSSVTVPIVASMASEAAHLDGMAILHQQLVPAWQHPDEVAALDSRVDCLLQHGRYAEALSWLEEVAARHAS